ncbi:MAG: hypothetical protein BMS9Abin02_0852 [Anaerolineae bacterium]|nr:MAG: hypothetical protein BMS9Abin02_0852 [Anaerolineae bacterium]
MKDHVNLKIDGQEVNVPKGTTILEAASQIGIDVPVICYHPNLTANGLCRICTVDIGARIQVAACVTDCQEGMEVHTQNESVIRGRKIILELLTSASDVKSGPDILALMDVYEVDESRFAYGERRKSPIYDDNPFYIRDYNQCINCWRCVQVCAEDAQYTFALTFNGRGFSTGIGTFMGDSMPDTTCVFCGLCVSVCPTDALMPIREKMLEDGVDPDDVFRKTRGGMKKVKR